MPNIVESPTFRRGTNKGAIKVSVWLMTNWDNIVRFVFEDDSRTLNINNTFIASFITNTRQKAGRILIEVRWYQRSNSRKYRTRNLLSTFHSNFHSIYTFYFPENWPAGAALDKKHKILGSHPARYLIVTCNSGWVIGWFPHAFWKK